MVLMIENGTRGGVAMISHRYAKANNYYMGDKYDATSTWSMQTQIICMGVRCNKTYLPTVLNGLLRMN